MKKAVKIEMEEYLYEFYNRIAKQAGKQTEKVMADSLMKFAGELSLNAIAQQNKPS